MTSQLLADKLLFYSKYCRAVENLVLCMLVLVQVLNNWQNCGEKKRRQQKLSLHNFCVFCGFFENKGC